MAGGGIQGRMSMKEAPIFRKDFRFPNALGKNQGPAMTPSWRPEILAKPQGMVEATNREIPPFPEKGL